MVRLKASTLIEVTVAMVLISIITTVTILVFLNTSSSLGKTAESRLEVIADAASKAFSHTDSKERLETTDPYGNSISIQALPHREYENLWMVVCTVSDSLDVNSVTIKRLMYVPGD